VLPAIVVFARHGLLQTAGLNPGAAVAMVSAAASDEV
jgi:hypothetical protein